MAHIKAKFKVDDVALIKEGEEGNKKVVAEAVTMSPVTGEGSVENQSFATATPSGSIQLQITNPEAFGKFIQGLEYYVDFTVAEQKSL